MSDDLREQAVSARAAGQHDRAVAAWRALLDAAPDDWRLGLELKRDLRAGLHYPDSDPRFRRAARGLPDAEWLAHYAALYAFHGSDLEAIDARAAALLEGAPGDVRLHAIRGDVARQRRDWNGAVAAFERAVALSGEVELGEKLTAARRYRTMAAQSWRADGPGYAAHVLNLDRNGERLEELRRQFAGGAVQPRRLPAVEGGRLARAAVQRLTGRADSARGTLGCFLSHASAWEAVAAGAEPWGLVLEDDVIPLLELPPTLGALGLPDGLELCFVNDRMEPRLPPSDGFVVHGLAAAMAAFHPEDNAPGGDGYLVSREGAVKLLDWAAADGMAGDADWRLLAWSLTPQAIAGIPAHSLARRELERLGAGVGRPERLRAGALSPALIRTVGVSSDREDEDRASITIRG